METSRQWHTTLLYANVLGTYYGGFSDVLGTFYEKNRAVAENLSISHEEVEGELEHLNLGKKKALEDAVDDRNRRLEEKWGNSSFLLTFPNHESQKQYNATIGLNNACSSFEKIMAHVSQSVYKRFSV